VFWVISVYFNIRNTLPKSGTFLLGHPVYKKLENLNGRGHLVDVDITEMIILKQTLWE
jgi:hypothetical protein